MNYQKIHDAIIDRARNRINEGYTENHHIIPKCLGGTDDPENFIRLTAREHFIVHQLLVKLHPNNSKLIFATNMMCVSNTLQERINNRMYAWLRERMAVAMSIAYSGEGNPQYGKPLSDEHRAKISDGLRGRIFTDEHRVNIGLSALGREVKPATREKISESLKGRKYIPRTPEEIEAKKKRSAAQSERQKGRTYSDLSRERIAEGMRQYHQRRKEGLTQQAAA